MKKIVKRVKKNHELSLALYDTGNGDAMYLAGLIADEKKITRQHLQRWAKNAPWHMISEYTVAWIAAESPYGWELALEWIESGKENIASSGWSTLASWVVIPPDNDLDLKQLSDLPDRVATTLHKAPNRVRYTMNIFILACGVSVVPLTEKAIETARKVGKIYVDMGDTACMVPSAESYIEKLRGKGKLGVKKKMARC